MTLRLIEEAVEMGFGDRITVVDMAPAVAVVKGIRVGGKLLEVSERFRGVRYLAPKRVETPRLRAESAKELLRLVDLNEKRIKPLLKRYIENPTPILFVNDISIYLQSGIDEPVLSAVMKAETFIANGYYGETLESDFETGVSNTERGLMKKIGDKMDAVIRL